MTVWALFPCSPLPRSRSGARRCARVRRARVLERCDVSRIALVEFVVRDDAGRRFLGRTWLPFERLASDRPRFAARWAALVSAEKSAAAPLAGADASRPAAGLNPVLP